MNELGAVECSESAQTVVVGDHGQPRRAIASRGKMHRALYFAYRHGHGS